MDLPRSFVIRESRHRIINPVTSEMLATLGRVMGLEPGMTILDLACGKGELLCTWARDHGIEGLGVDISSAFIQQANDRARELDVADRVAFVHSDAAGYVTEDPVDVASCVGATWIGEGVAGTIGLLEKSLKPGGLLVVGEPYWRKDPPNQETVEGCHVTSKDEYMPLYRLVEQFQSIGWDVVEMVLANQDSWDRYVAAQWMSIRRFIDANPDDELVPEFRQELGAAPVLYTKYQREYLGWGTFVLLKR